MALRLHVNIVSRSSLSQKVSCRANPPEVAPRRTSLPSAFVAAGSALVISLSPVEAAWAGRISADFANVEYKQVPCEKGRLTCLEFSGDITNPDKKSGINTADVFGRVYDAAGNGVTDIEENNRIAYVDFVPSGTSRVTFGLTVATQQFEQGPLKWKGLKLTGFTGKVLPGQAGLTGLLDNSIDCSAVTDDSPSFEVEECENQALENAIR